MVSRNFRWFCCASVQHLNHLVTQITVLLLLQTILNYMGNLKVDFFLYTNRHTFKKIWTI
jgi:hypothetical protein